eukprot:TRINITY_DN54102_c0_g1_i1.p2 TRINITY_DN54102_c0_g1~~TRINITY_DN54102_c0_g1_i1.p2  ORF type:complete len:107 (-),score=17.32 TRINITY_DN54102_c0_g1_i1:77-397(-)
MPAQHASYVRRIRTTGCESESGSASEEFVAEEIALERHVFACDDAKDTQETFYAMRMVRHMGRLRARRRSVEGHQLSRKELQSERSKDDKRSSEAFAIRGSDVRLF